MTPGGKAIPGEAGDAAPGRHGAGRICRIGTKAPAPALGSGGTGAARMIRTRPLSPGTTRMIPERIARRMRSWASGRSDSASRRDQRPAR
jgi:hypothetical protein